MRLSSISMYQTNLQRMVDTQDRWQQSGVRLTTGKRIMTPSDDPVASAKALLLKQAKERNQQLQGARDEANDALNRQEAVLDDVTKVIDNIKQLLVRAGNELLSNSDRQALKSELHAYKEQLVSLANATDGNGRYIFAGYKNDTPPFVINDAGEVSYVGGDKAVEISIDDNRRINLFHTGIDAFLTGAKIKEPDGTPSERDIFKSIDYALKALEMDLQDAPETVREEYRQQIGKASRGMDNALDNNARVRSEGGSILAEIEQLKELGNTFDMNYQLDISNLEDLPAYDAISEYLMLQASLQASQQVFLYMQNMSLFQMK